MNPFNPDLFFDYSKSEHRDLFSSTPYVWEILKNLDEYLKNYRFGKIEGKIEAGAHLFNPESITLGVGSIVEAGAYIRGPLIVGKNTTIRHGAYIRGYAIIGDNCVVGHTTEIKNAIFLDGAHAGHFSYVGDSILGNRVNLGAGVKCANLRLDQKPISFFHNGQKIETQLKKLGAILGDDVQLGCNSVTNPGTLMGKKSRSYPCVSIKGFISENGVVT